MGFCFILSFLAAGSCGDKYTMFTAAAGKKYYGGRVWGTHFVLYYFQLIV